jgi:hypothetical protein
MELLLLTSVQTNKQDCLHGKPRCMLSRPRNSLRFAQRLAYVSTRCQLVWQVWRLLSCLVQIATLSISAFPQANSIAGDSEWIDPCPSQSRLMKTLSLFWNIQTHEILAGCNRSLPRTISLASCDTKLPDETPTSARDISMDYAPLVCADAD